MIVALLLAILAISVGYLFGSYLADRNGTVLFLESFFSKRPLSDRYTKGQLSQKWYFPTYYKDPLKKVIDNCFKRHKDISILFKNELEIQSNCILNSDYCLDIPARYYNATIKWLNKEGFICKIINSHKGECFTYLRVDVFLPSQSRYDFENIAKPNGLCFTDEGYLVQK